MINLELAKERNLSLKQIHNIKRLQARRAFIFDEMKKIDCVGYLRNLDKELNELEKDLQFNWGFEINQDFVKFWERPKCTCPKIDNIDNYPFGNYWISETCVLHGS